MTDTADHAKALAQAAQAGFATGLIADQLDAMSLWHGPPDSETTLREAWVRGYQAGRTASRGVAGSLKNFDEPA